MIKKATIPTILGIIILIAGVFTGVFFLNNIQVFRIGASAQSAPKDIRVSNITDSSATISWTTDKETSGILNWGNSDKNTAKIEVEGQSGQKFYNHSISLSGLVPDTDYFYKINSDGTSFDNGGIPWKFTTGKTLNVNDSSILISGNVINASGITSKRALVYANINNYLLSTPTSDTGNFVFQIGSVRTPDLANYATVDMGSTIIQISVVAPPDGVASAQIFPSAANPVPTIVIGQVYDFRDQPANGQGDTPSAELSLPEKVSPESKFDVSIPSATSKPTSVILESLTEGETVTSDKPQFFGKGPSGETITIKVNSQEEITDTVQIPQDGSWSYSVPTNLEPGNHTVTVSWLDGSGITRFLTRNFVVKAGEVPSFTASESGSLKTPSPAPSISPSPAATETAMPVPVTGDLTPTLILFIMGLAVIAFSFTVWKVSEN